MSANETPPDSTAHKLDRPAPSTATATARPASPGLRAAALTFIAVAAVAIVVGGVTALGVGTIRPEEPRLVLLGEPVPSDASAEWFLERLRARAAAPFSLTLHDGQKRTFRAHELGLSVDSDRVRSWFAQEPDGNGGLSVNRFGGGAVALPVPLTVDEDRSVEILIRLKDELDRAPQDARVDFASASGSSTAGGAEVPDGGNDAGHQAQRIIPEQDGRWLDVGASLDALRRAVESGQHASSIVYREVKARRSAAELGGASFDAILGEFDTPYDRSRRSRSRTFNLALAASKLDGTVLMPGEVFDFNVLVGPRDEANGYQVAPVIAQGELVDGIGGGTCQVSGTLHAASYFAGLEVLERNPHTRPSSYIKLGLDAAVAYPSLNLRLKNPYDFPIALRESVRDGRVHAEVRGPGRVRTVTFIRRIVRALPYEETTREEPGLKRGERRLAQRGVAGFQVRRYRIVRDGAHAVREKTEDIYPATPQIVLLGTGGEPAKKLTNDKHPEYRADELLVMTLEREGDIAEQRRPGRFGNSGWTEREGMPVWKSKDE